MSHKVYEKLDQEWVDLMLEAKKAGLNLADVRAFFVENNKKGMYSKVSYELWPNNGSAHGKKNISV
ncbi:anti-repressor SinI family protein [Lentibacillus songyuanensis]|uniref:anti-repressor SinI family protein n=1 Tax=Lentibacillus songyuanensis TaxID=3136161 RepID=UPI0038621698